MGMFDDVHVDYPLPDCSYTEFQTKDLECTLEQYTISADGKLLSNGVDIAFHGILNFYTYDKSPGERDVAEWYEYDAKFTDGQLVSITRVYNR